MGGIYGNPLDGVEALAHHFFSRTLKANVTPYVVTKKTVFKFQEPFWQIMKAVFNASYKTQFAEKGLLDETHGELAHLISDAACMKFVTWKDGDFACVAHNYDGDMLTDLISQLHRSPAFLTSVLVGQADDGSYIKEFEASHGTVSEMYIRLQEGGETSLNPLGMVIALCDAMTYSAEKSGGNHDAIVAFAEIIKSCFFDALRDGKATRDVCGPTGLTTEAFIQEIATRINAARGGAHA